MLKALKDNVHIGSRKVDLKNATQKTLQLIKKLAPHVVEEVKTKKVKVKVKEEQKAKHEDKEAQV